MFVGNVLSAEDLFKGAVRAVVRRGEYPSALRVHRARGQVFPRADLNGCECQWRREVCRDIGFRLKGRNL